MEYSILYLYLFSHVIIRYLILSDCELSATVFPSVSFICQHAYVFIYPHIVYAFHVSCENVFG